MKFATFAKSWSRLLVAAMVLFSSAPAFAALERVGPNLPNFGFPAWYQDKTGLTLEFCSPLTQAELDGGYCLLLTGDTTAPEAFPGSFFDEHFYFAADAISALDAAAGVPAPFANGSPAKLVLAIEGAFAAGAVIQGDQITFARLRIVVTTVPVSGRYRVFTPYGVREFDQDAGSKLFYTEDIGIQCPPGNFDCTLAGSIGPFLLPSATAGGAEQAAVGGGAPGKLYIADPARIGSVTGSPIKDAPDGPFTLGGRYIIAQDATDPLPTVDPNVFRIEVQQTGTSTFQKVFQTTDFSLMGRIFSGVTPGKVTVERASYATASSGNSTVDVFATGLPTTQGRIPPNLAGARIQPALAFYAAPCGGTPIIDPDTGIQTGVAAPFTKPVGEFSVGMAIDGNTYWGQSAVALLPAQVCVEDSNARNAANTVVPAYIPAPLTDVVTITQALFDPAGQKLTVKATSSDAFVNPDLSVAAFGSMLADQLIVGGTTDVTPVVAVPSKVRVVSNAGGISELFVTTGAAVPPTAPVAVDDLIQMVGGIASLNVIGNDRPVPGIPLATATNLGNLQVPAGGVANDVSVGANGTVNFSVTGAGTYTFTYQVQDQNGTLSANSATVTVNVLAGPVANNDTFNAIAGIGNSLNVLGNDTVSLGAPALVTVTNLNNLVVPAGGVANDISVAANGTVNFNVTGGGTYSFTYQAVDAEGHVSNQATATVQVAANETLAIASARYRLSTGRWDVAGSVAPARVGATVKVYNGNLNTNPAAPLIGTASVVAGGAWTLQSFTGGTPTSTAVTAVSDIGTTTVFAPIRVQ